MKASTNLPGYCGHVPFKQEFVGLTTGAQNQACEQTYRELRGDTMLKNGQQVFSPRSSRSNFNPYYKSDKIMQHGNNSKYSVSWLCGPKHNVRAQQIPGYTGFMSGVTSENQYGRSYAKNAAKSMNGKIIQGHDVSPEKKY